MSSSVSTGAGAGASVAGEKSASAEALRRKEEARMALEARLEAWMDDAAGMLDEDEDEQQQELENAMRLMLKYCSLPPDEGEGDEDGKDGPNGGQSSAGGRISRYLSNMSRRSSVTMLLGRRSTHLSNKEEPPEDIREAIQGVLEDMEMGSEFSKFVANDVTTLEACHGLNHNNLKKMGIETFKERQKLLEALSQWNGKPNITLPDFLESLPRLKFNGNLIIQENFALTELKGITVMGDLNARSMKELETARDLWIDGNLNLSGSRGLKSLSHVYVKGSLHISECNDLVSIADHVTATQSVVARECVSILKLPENLVLEDKLDLKGALSLQKLPRGLRIGGRLILKECEALEELPDDLQVMKSIGLRRCVKLRRLPQSLVCREHIDLHGCESIEVLPDNFTVEGWANLSSMNIRKLPDVMRIGSNLRLDETPIRELPSGVTVGGFLQMRRCTELLSLPDNLHVPGNFELDASTSLASLPAGLRVNKDLSLRDCTSLTELPSDMQIGLGLNIEGCVGITSLPPAILEWGPTESPMMGMHSRSRPHHIVLRGSGIPDEEMESLAMLENPNLQFHVSRTPEHIGIEESFRTIQEGVVFWMKHAKMNVTEENELRVDAYISNDAKRGFLLFLEKLTLSAEFKNQQMRPGLAKRVVAVLEMICEDDFARDELITRAIDSNNSCGDKPIHALNQMTLILRVVNAREDRKKLRRVGLGVMRLGIVHEHVEKKIQSLPMVDDVCVYLRFEISLAEELGLPVSALDMLFPSFIRVSDEEIDAARQEALNITDEQFETWLRTWPEWQRQLRFEAAQEIEFGKLRRNSRRYSLSWSDLLGNRMEDPVRVSANSIFSLKDLLRHWVATGLDLNNQPRTIEEMKHLTRCRSLPKHLSLGRAHLDKPPTINEEI